MDRAVFERWLIQRTNRRRFLAGLAAAPLAMSRRGQPTRPRQDAAAVSAGTDPFSLGVASGDPLPDGVVLWTRLAPDPLNGGGMPPEPVEVRWEIASDEGFTRVLRSGVTTARPELAHSVHVDATGLEPGRIYFYRFAARGMVSPAGRTRTAPAPGGALDRLRLGVASCAHWEHGYFTAYRHLAAEDLDAVLFLGDYLYEYPPGQGFVIAGQDPIRLHTPGELITLKQYRNRYAQYRTDPDLQATHAAFPWIATWDDHEVANNYAGVHSERGDSPAVFLARRAAAYQAYYEHMPLRPESLPQGPEMRIYRRITFGNLAEISVLDTRQYRSAQPCGDTVAPRCAAALDPALTLTGPEQERWLLDGLASASAQWKVIAQQVMMAELAVRVLGPEPQYNDDQWDGYPLARNRILGFLQQAGISDTIVLSGDVHSAWVSDVKADFFDADSPTVATEFVATSITAHNPFGSRLAVLLPGNPHIRFFDIRHGYTRCTITPRRWQADFRAVPDVTMPDAPVETIASFAVEAGQPGAQPV
ncbi:MAG: alkaline phosphatase [Thermomicrobiales bacterium]|nr:MAG: alkaline phosphatase [Thermomicrobiales bacterium]